jgi:uncharacterized protein (DUF1015 family)
VIAPPYDVVSTGEARAIATGRPWCFLHVSRPEIDLAADADPYSSAVYAQGAASFQRMRAEGVLVQDANPYLYVYRLTQGGHSQTGLVAVASVRAYESGRIRRHELTRAEKEDDRVRHMEALNAQTGPAFLTYRHDRRVDRLIDAVVRAEPEVDVVAPDGVRHTQWVVSDREAIAALARAFEGIERLYIADGHHRSAAAARLARARQAADPRPDAPEDYFLAVIFPDDQVRILAYHRVVRELGGMSPERFLERLAARFEVEPTPAAAAPGRPGEMALCLPTGWYRVRLGADQVTPDDPVGRLDVSLLSSHVLGPMLGITDLRRDTRIDFVGGVRGLGELEGRVRAGEAAAAFALYPTRIGDLLSVADAGLMMPPKSTWFEPKLADGLVSHVLG